MAPKQSTKQKTTLVLLDAHAILHRAYHALPDDFTSPTGEPTGALYGMVAMLLRIAEDVRPDHIVACFDLPGPTYRHDAFADYKATRTKTDDSLVSQIERSREILAAFGIPIYEHPGFEADDMLGTIVEQVRARRDLDVVIASGDMDTLQLVDKKRVRVYMQRRGSEVVMYDEAAIKEKFGFGPSLTVDYKGLRGDASDNIPGVPGVGETSAQKLVATFGTLEKIQAAIKKQGVENVAKKAGIQKRFVQLVADHDEEALFSKMLATIRRDAPITFTVPEASWKESVDTDAVLALFSRLGFRSLTARVKSALALPADTPSDGAGVEGAAIHRAAVMLWLLESDRTNPTYDDILEYGRSYFQTESFEETCMRLEEALKTDGLYEVFTDIEVPLMEVIAYMNGVGVLLDTKHLARISKQFHKELSGIERRIYKHAGTEFNVNSPKQLGDVLYDTLGLKPKHQKKTATGQRSTRESELVKMQDEHPIIKEILRYRELAKLLGTYIDNLPELVGDDGRLRTTFLQTGTTTGRIASKDPNLQNIPIRSEEGRAMRRAFVAERGYDIVSIDYSQIDLRMAAILSGDEKLIDIFKRGEDVHSGVASRVFGVAPDDVTKEMRRRAKVINFGILYGMGVNALRGNLGEDATRAEAQEFLNAYFNTFTRLAEYLDETKAFARTHGYTETLFGRRRHFPGITSSAPFIRASAERMAINAPVQGTAADAVRIAMNRVYAHLQENNLFADVRMLLQVHDEIVFEVKQDRRDEVVPELVELMEGVLDAYDTRGVPVSVEVAIGPNWTEVESWKVNK